MKNLIRIAIVSSVAALTAFAFTAKADAQSTTVNFTGSNPGTCVINSTTPGVLGIVSTSELAAQPGTGTQGLIRISCNTGVRFTVVSLSDNGSSLSGAGYSNIDTVNVAVLDDLANTLAVSASASPNGSPIGNPPTGIAGGLQAGPIISRDYRVGFSVVNNNPVRPLPFGTYNIDAVISLSPQ